MIKEGGDDDELIATFSAAGAHTARTPLYKDLCRREALLALNTAGAC